MTVSKPNSQPDASRTVRTEKSIKAGVSGQLQIKMMEGDTTVEATEAGK